MPKVTRARLGTRWNSSSENVSQARGSFLGCLIQGPAREVKVSFIMAVPPVYMERSTAGDHEVFGGHRSGIARCGQNGSNMGFFGSTSS